MTALHASALEAADLAELVAWCTERRDEAIADIDADPLAWVDLDPRARLPWSLEWDECDALDAPAEVAS